jgi:putative aminopeptidase FrvX
MNICIRWIVAVAAACLIFVQFVKAQGDLSRLQETIAVSGYEQELTAAIRQELKAFGPHTDEIGNIWVTFGTGAPQRLIATAIDEPGYVVSGITEEGYLRVQRLPQAPPNGVFDSLNFAQPVVVLTRSGKHVDGVFAGLSVHLQPRRLNPPKMNDVEELYVDVGAKGAQEARAVGVDMLDPIALARTDYPRGMAVPFSIGRGTGQAGPATAEKVEFRTLLALVQRIKESHAPGTTTIAFVTQQWLGGRGLNRLLTEIHPDVAPRNRWLY